MAGRRPAISRICSLVVSAALPFVLLADSPSFDVATIKQSAPRQETVRGNITYTKYAYEDQGGPGTSSPERWSCGNIPLLVLLQKAWGVSRYQIAIAPSLGDTRYDVVANVPPETNRRDFGLMIQRLLAERIGLAVHFESREVEAEELVIAKSGLKMKIAEPAPSTAPTGPSRVTFDADGIPHLPPGQPKIMQFARGAIFIIGRMQGIQELINQLQRPLVVLDKTGLTGKYDFLVRYELPGSLSSSDKSLSNIPRTLEDAIEEQLGLKLHSTKATVDVVVVDRVNKTPTEN